MLSVPIVKGACDFKLLHFYHQFPWLLEPHVSLMTPLRINFIVPLLSQSGQKIHRQALNHTQMKDTTHQPMKPARLNSHSVPKRVNGTRMTAIAKKTILKAYASFFAFCAAAGSIGLEYDASRKSTTTFPVGIIVSGVGSEQGCFSASRRDGDSASWPARCGDTLLALSTLPLSSFVFGAASCNGTPCKILWSRFLASWLFLASAAPHFPGKA